MPRRKKEGTRASRTSETVNRGWLKRQILNGNVEAKRDYRHTDDYVLDAATDFGRTDWMPAHLPTEEESVKGYSPDGRMKFQDRDFRGYGHAWWNEDGAINLDFGWESYTLRLNDDQTEDAGKRKKKQRRGRK